MAQGLDVDIREIVLSNSSFGPSEIDVLASSISSEGTNLATLRDAVQQLQQKDELTPATKVRLGVCLYLLGRFQPAINCLSSADGGAIAQFYLGRSHLALRSYDKAEASFKAAAGAGYNADQSTLGSSEALRLAGDYEGSLKLLDGLSGAVEQTAEYLSQRAATVARVGAEPQEVAALYERAVEADENHPAALFGLALINDRYGNDLMALELYQRACKRLPAHVGSLLNLGIMYEDRNEYENARRCYRRVLEIYPDHPQARLYYKDADASTSEHYDEDALREQDRLGQVLNTPVTDFELSVRSRNCLERMGIHTLGDLTRITEPQLLASKNFGETSLVEIREIMNAKNLEVGQFASERQAMEFAIETETLSPDEQAMLNKPVAELNLSVRARKCMIRLNIATIGELVRRTGDELLECKNFGVTSLNEVREKLTIQSLKLRGD